VEFLTTLLLSKLATSSDFASSSSLNSGFKRYQNSPNPSSSETRIRYKLLSAYSNAQIQILDMTGRNLKSYNLPKASKSEIVIGPNSLAQGTYVYSLIVDGKTVDSKFMIILK
jgi:trimeric autotransporter adhesin